MLEIFMVIGNYTPDQFWDMTLGDIILIINGYNKRKTEEIKQNYALIYNLASLTSVGYASTRSKKIKFPKIYDAFPTLFEKPSTPNWMRLKANMLNFTNEHNRQWSEQHT